MLLLDVPHEALPHYVTVHQLAKTLQCCPQTVRNWCKRGLLPQPLSLGRRKRLWDITAVRQALESMRERMKEESRQKTS